MHISGRNADFAAVKVAWTALLLLVLGNLNVVDAADCVVHDKVSFQLNWVWQAQFAGFQAASSLGYFGDECLNVQIRQGETTFNGLSEVSEGRAVFGNAWTSGVAAAHTMGENLTIVMQHFQRSGLRFLSKKRPDINEFTDLANKKVSTFIFNYIDLALTSSLAKYNVANVSVIPQSFTPFKLFSEDGTAVDAVSVMVYNELAQILEFRNPSTNALYRQDQMKIFDVNDLGTNMLEDNIFVRSDWLEKEENKNITRRFLRAVTKGWIYCRDHEDDCRNLLYDHGPHQQWMMREVNRLIWPSPLGFGMMDPDTLNRTVDVISTVVTGNRSSYPLSDNSYILWAKNSLQSSGWDVKGDGWTQPRLHFCMNSGETTPHICDDIEATVCEAGYHPVGPNSCGPCPPGSFSAHIGTGNVCQACPSGTFSSRFPSGGNAKEIMDEQAAIVCLGCPSGTKKSADGRVVCGQAGFEETLVGLLNANKAMIGAWFCAVTLAALGYLFIRRRFPECEAFLYLEAVFSMIETILDAVFLNLLRTSGLMKHFAIGVTGFSCHFVINSVIVGMFLHHEFRSSHVRRWAEKHVSVVPAAVMLSVMNPELLGLMSSRLGPITYTHAPFSPKSLAALQFSTFVAFVAGKTPQLCVELLILSSDGWHLDPFLASVTTLILLVRGILHFLIYYILQLYRKRRGARGSARSSQTGSQHSKGGSKLDVAIRKSNPYSNDIERLKVDLSAARKRVLELEEIMQLYLETPADYEQPRMPTTEILATAVISAPLSRRPSSIANRGDLEFKVPA